MGYYTCMDTSAGLYIHTLLYTLYLYGEYMPAQCCKNIPILLYVEVYTRYPLFI